MKFFFLFCLTFLALDETSIAYSQKNNNPPAQENKTAIELSNNSIDSKTKFTSLMNDLDGTFQFQIKKQDYRPLLTIEILESIRDSRKISEDIYLELDEYIKVFIPSSNKINSIDFVSLDQFVELK